MIETSLGMTEKGSFQSVTIFPVNIYYFIVKINEGGGRQFFLSYKYQCLYYNKLYPIDVIRTTPQNSKLCIGSYLYLQASSVTLASYRFIMKLHHREYYNC